MLNDELSAEDAVKDEVVDDEVVLDDEVHAEDAVIDEVGNDEVAAEEETGTTASVSVGVVVKSSTQACGSTAETLSMAMIFLSGVLRILLIY